MRLGHNCQLSRDCKQPPFQNKPKTAPIYIFFIIIINAIYYKLCVTNKRACNILNWNHSFIWKAKTEAILQKLAICSKSGNKTYLQSHVSWIWLERWKRRKAQELQRGAVTWPYIYSLKYIGVILWKFHFFSVPSLNRNITLKKTWLHFYTYIF